MEVDTNGRDYGIVNVCWCRPKANSNATFMCSKVMAELSEDNKILRIEKLK